MYMYVCISLSLYICIYMYGCMYVCIYMYTCIHTYIYIYICIQRDINVQGHELPHPVRARAERPLPEGPRPPQEM